MIVRELKREDIPQVISLGAAMHFESEYGSLDFDGAKVAATCYQILEDDKQLGLVVEDEGLRGMLAGFVAEYDYGQDLIASDRLVYVEPHYRGSLAFVRLIAAFYRWARSKGAVTIFLAQTTGVNMAKMADYYGRLGFHPVGTIYKR